MCDMTDNADLPVRSFGWWDMFIDEDNDPRADGGWENDERSVILGFLDDRRLTLELKCQGLAADQLAQRSVPPSDLSLIGLVRHLAGVESYWFREAITGEEGRRLYVDADGNNVAFDVDGDDEVVDEAWSTWRSEVAHSRTILEAIDDLGALGRGRPVPIREVLVHLVR